jgi:hypothetical protein
MKSIVLAMLLGIAVVAPAKAADPRYPDWPCVQAKVPEISIAAVWSGPPIDDVLDNWRNDSSVRDLVARLAARRTDIETAQQAVSDFVTGDEAQRQMRAKLLFAGLFVTLNAERTQIMDGLERFQRNQIGFADRIRSEIQTLRALQDSENSDLGKAEALSTQLQWDQRMFEERRRTTSYACEVPVLIERRLFALARAIEQSLQ